MTTQTTPSKTPCPFCGGNEFNTALPDGLPWHTCKKSDDLEACPLYLIAGWAIVTAGIFGFMCLLLWSMGMEIPHKPIAVISGAFAIPLYGTIRA